LDSLCRMRSLIGSWICLWLVIACVEGISIFDGDELVLFPRPGFKTTVSSKGITYLKDVGIVMLERDLQSIAIPSVDGDVGTPIGNVHYKLTNLILSSLVIPRSNVTLIPKSGAELIISGTSAHLSMNWEYRKTSFPHVSDSGTANVDVSNTAIDVSVSVTMQNGRPYANVESCVVHVGKLDMDIHGGASWLYKIFVDHFSGTIKGMVEKTLSSSISREINDGANAALASLPVVQPISNSVEIDYSLLSVPTVEETHFTLSHKGEFYYVGHRKEAPFKQPALPDLVTDEMVQMFISDYVANTAAYSYYLSDALRVVITDSMLPEDAPIHLNTSYFADLAPPLPIKFPDELMEIHVYATSSPIFSFSVNGSSASVLGNVDVYILPERIFAFTLIVNLLCSGTAHVNNLNIVGQLTFLKAEISLGPSMIGRFDVTDLQSIVNYLSKEGIIPLVNDYLKPGFPLPTIQGLTFVNPVIGWGPRYIYVSTDASYSPPSLVN